MSAIAKDAFDLAVVGHFSIDSIILSGKSPCTILGGAVAYVSLVARVLGASASVISKVGCDFPEAYVSQLKEAGVNTSHIVKELSERTTSFELTYNQDLSSRKLRMRSQGSPITLENLPLSLSSKAIHIAPIASEISYDVVEHLRDCCDCLSIDPQGMTRRFDKNGNVTNSTQMDKRILSLVDIYKSSLDEIQILTEKTELEEAAKTVHSLGPKTVIVTMGAKGSVLSTQGKFFDVPACKSTRVVDPTGAGDVFIGAFLTEFIREKEPFWCSCVGAAAASLVVEGAGTSFFGEKAEIYRRANAVHERYVGR
jgi:sugar/nucleoside kinase (ribokinase family)